MNRDARELIQAADAARARAEALESIRRDIRLGDKPRTRLGRIFTRDRYGHEETLTPAETHELYEWCGKKQDELLKEAAALDARVTVEPDAA